MAIDYSLRLASGITTIALVSMSTAVMAQPALPSAPDTTEQQSATPEVEAASAGGLQKDEIVVTARRRSESLQKVPLAVTALSAESLRERNISSAIDLQANVPSLTLNAQRSHQNVSFNIRGLGQGTVSGATVVTYFAEAPSPTAGTSSDAVGGLTFYDLQNVQVLKGPQGTLFGRAAAAGAVLITPQLPRLDRIEGYNEITVGTRGNFVTTGAINLPILDDQLAVRFAYNIDRRDGYTDVIGSNLRLDETHSDSFRASVQFNPKDTGFKNYTVFDYFRFQGTPAASILVGGNPGAASLNRSAAFFAGVCGQAVGFGFNATVAECQAQRVAILASLRAQIIAEVARTSAGGDALRSTLPGVQPFRAFNQRLAVINNAQLDVGDFGLGDITFKDIFSYQRTRGLTSVGTGVVGTLVDSTFGSSATSNQSGNLTVSNNGPYNDFYSNESTINGNVSNSLLIYTAGYYFQRAPVTPNIVGVGNLTRSTGGVTVPNLGYVAAQPFQVGGANREHAFFGQATLDLSSFVLEGLHLTAGYRKTSTHNVLVNAAAVISYPSGTLTPGARTTTDVRTGGPTWVVALDYAPTDTLTLYATSRRGYKPGGINLAVGAAGLPNYAPQFGSEKLTDYEIGAKFKFNLGGMPGHLYVDAYREDYTDIQRGFLAINSAGLSVSYTANVAAAKLQGIEIEGSIEPIEGLELSGNYSLQDNKYTSWKAGDPLNIAPAGTILDLSNQPFGNAPRNKINLAVQYTLPLDDSVGRVSLRVQGSWQSVQYLNDTYQRYIDILGPSVGPSIRQDSYAVLNARVDWRNVASSRFDLALFVTNLTNKIYAAGGNAALTSTGNATKVFNEPRIFALQAAYRF